MKLTVTDDPDADLVICVKASDPTPYSDNVRGVCSWCGVAIQWRPSVPAKPKKVCLQCGVGAIAEDADAAELLLSKATVNEVLVYFKKREH